MSRKDKRPGHDDTLVETQGVNAGDPVDEPEEAPDREEGRGEADHSPSPRRTGRPSGMTSDEMVGLPEERPGYPGQQRSVDTS
jgi:hypothetical protein